MNKKKLGLYLIYVMLLHLVISTSIDVFTSSSLEEINWVEKIISSTVFSIIFILVMAVTTKWKKQWEK